MSSQSQMEIMIGTKLFRLFLSSKSCVSSFKSFLNIKRGIKLFLFSGCPVQAYSMKRAVLVLSDPRLYENIGPKVGWY